MRRALAHQVRRPQHAVGAGRHARRLGGQFVVGDAPSAPATQLVAQPAQRQPGGLRHAHHVPASREWRGRTCGAGRFGSGAGRSVAAKTTPDVPMVALTAPGRVMPMPDRAGRLIARAGDDRRALAQAGRARPPRATRARRSSGDSKTAGSSVRSMPAASSISCDQRATRDVEQQRARRVGDVDRVLAAQPEAHVVLRQQHVAHARPDVGLVRRTQSSFVSVKFVSAGLDVSSSSRSRADGLVEPAALGLGALIAPDDRRPQHLAARVEQHGAVHLSREADRTRSHRRATPLCGEDRADGHPGRRATSRRDPARPRRSAARRTARGPRSPTPRRPPSSSRTGRASRWCRRRCRELEWRPPIPRRLKSRLQFGTLRAEPRGLARSALRHVRHSASNADRPPLAPLSWPPQERVEVEHLSVLHDALHAPQILDVRQRVAVDRSRGPRACPARCCRDPRRRPSPRPDTIVAVRSTSTGVRPPDA